MSKSDEKTIRATFRLLEDTYTDYCTEKDIGARMVYLKCLLTYLVAAANPHGLDTVMLINDFVGKLQKDIEKRSCTDHKQ